MIDDNGRMVVFLPTVNHGGEEGCEVLSVHDTYSGAAKAMRDNG